MSEKYSVVIGVPYPGGWLSDRFVQSLMPVAAETMGVFWQPGALVPFSRNDLARRFLDTRGAEWLLFVDSDMVLARETLPMLLRHKAPIVGALYSTRLNPTQLVARRKDADGIYQSVRVQAGEEAALLRVDSLGMGCTLIHRIVFERIPYPWFEVREEYNDKFGRWRRTGEDVDFCAKADRACFGVWLDCSVRAGHIDPKVIGPTVNVPEHDVEVAPV